MAQTDMPIEWLTHAVELELWRILVYAGALVYLGMKWSELRQFNELSTTRKAALNAVGNAYLAKAALSAANDVATEQGYKTAHEQAVVDALNEARGDLRAAETVAEAEAIPAGTLGRLAQRVGLLPVAPTTVEVDEARERLEHIRSEDGTEGDTGPVTSSPP